MVCEREECSEAEPRSRERKAMELVSIAATVPGRGVGRALLSAAVALAREQRASRVWLITTNDNLRALRFYQLNGLRIVAVDRGAVDRARMIKPTIPRVGAEGIPVHDELVLELRLDTAADRTAHGAPKG
jgi:GNAT superfamily N-acetyltransferase